MKTLLVNVSDSEGGAARVTQRLHHELLRNGVDSRYFVQFSRTDDLNVMSPSGKRAKLFARLRPELDRLPLMVYPRAQGGLFSPSVVPDDLPGTVRRVDPDVVHLNWICKGFVRIESIARIPKPVVWTFHDSWGFTGGCHVPLECRRYQHGCGQCPQLSSKKNRDLSRRVYSRKSGVFRRKDIAVVCPSTWLADCARTSPLLEHTRIEVIPNGIDANVFQPVDRLVARRIFGLPPDTRIILFGAMSALTDRNKGFPELSEALAKLAQSSSGGKLLLVVFGAREPVPAPRFGIPARYVGRLFDDISLSILYSAADVFVAPSLQENLPTTVMEAMACGTPVVAFNSSGFPDLIRHGETGYLAAPFDASDLAHGMDWILSDPSRPRTLGDAARKTVEERFRIGAIAGRYVNLYERLLDVRKESE